MKTWKDIPDLFKRFANKIVSFKYPQNITNCVLATFPMKNCVVMDIWKSFYSFIHLTFKYILRRWHKKGQSSLNFAIDFFF